MNIMEMMSATKSVSECILQAMESDPKSLDLSISFVAAALQSYRHHSVLRPFPGTFISNDGEQTKLYHDLHNLLMHLKSIKHLNLDLLTAKEEDFLAWICNCKGYSIKTCKRSQFQIIQRMTGHHVKIPAPADIFEIFYNEGKNVKFQQLKGEHKSIFAYHGSKLENFHSILNYGLNAHMSKNALFGEGTYLTSELSVAMSFCPTGRGWKHSCLGEKLGCVAVCEIIDDPSINCQEKHPNSNGTDRGRIHGSEGGRIPEKYYIVQNNELVRVRYLLIYAENKTSSTTTSWITKHRFCLLMLTYLVLLLSVALHSNQVVKKTLQRVFKGFY